MDKLSFFVIAMAVLCLSCPGTSFASERVSLNGQWEIGSERTYDRRAMVPGIATNPEVMNDGDLWYRREVELPDGDWDSAVLVLKGARFAPRVFVDGALVSSAEGGMTQTEHLLRSEGVYPGNTVTIEVALTSLADLSEQDASYIPIADHWRSNVSSSLWDDVELHVFKGARLTRVRPISDTEAKSVEVRFVVEASSAETASPTVTLQVRTAEGHVAIEEEAHASPGENVITFSYADTLTEWTPENPVLYEIVLKAEEGGSVLDEISQTFAPRRFVVQDKQFRLNGEPYKLRAGTVVWHRWVRDDEARELAYDEQWFLDNIVMRLKDHGANTLRFHLGNPPERFLDLCDEYGLAVQYEWSFFHGLPASVDSMVVQWRDWLDMAARHPSVVLIHPNNETEGHELANATLAIEAIEEEYEPFVLKDRDVLHIHKYWWSLFENVGVYYDSFDEFPLAIMADEFGGNYLDGEGQLGGYRTLEESFLRFLGPDHTAEERLRHQSLANARVAEYWRRIGAAGFSPFTILASWEDGNTWFMGDLEDGQPKPVWNALTAAWSPVSVSIDLWDRNFDTGHTLQVPLHLFNDTGQPAEVEVRVTLEDADSTIVRELDVAHAVEPYSKRVRVVDVELPEEVGAWRLKAQLLNAPSQVKHSVVSEWVVRTFAPTIPHALRELTLGVLPDDAELGEALELYGLTTADPARRETDVIVTSRQTWQGIKASNERTVSILERQILAGRPVVLLDVGEGFLGEGYMEDLGPESFQQVRQVDDPFRYAYDIVLGLRAEFVEAAEPESHIHSYGGEGVLWNGLAKDSAWLWNGLRGGLVVPSETMQLEGLSREAWVDQWVARGAEADKIRRGPYYASILQGYYAFSDQADHSETEAHLRDRVVFLVEDAPALASSIDPRAPIETLNLAEIYRQGEFGEVTELAPLVAAGKGLTKTPVVRVSFGPEKGDLIISQLITHGRLLPTDGRTAMYDKRYDPVARQMLLNIVAEAVAER